MVKICVSRILLDLGTLKLVCILIFSSPVAQSTKNMSAIIMDDGGCENAISQKAIAKLQQETDKNLTPYKIASFKNCTIQKKKKVKKVAA